MWAIGAQNTDRYPILRWMIMEFVAPGDGWQHRRWAYTGPGYLLLRYDTTPDGGGVADSGSGCGRITDDSSDGKET
ncbi:hypothetical protein GCM10009664_47110 [Kitasatospora gansuensis]